METKSLNKVKIATILIFTLVFGCFLAFTFFGRSSKDRYFQYMSGVRLPASAELLFFEEDFGIHGDGSAFFVYRFPASELQKLTKFPSQFGGWKQFRNATLFSEINLSEHLIPQKYYDELLFKNNSFLASYVIEQEVKLSFLIADFDSETLYCLLR